MIRRLDTATLSCSNPLDETRFDSVCRTACSTRVEDRSGEVFPIGVSHRSFPSEFPIGALTPFAGERYVVVPGASVTNQRYGPVQVVCWHEPPHENPVPLVTTLECAE
jgi:hypothetical protein